MYYCSYAPISWKTYPFLDLPVDGASVEEKTSVIFTHNFWLIFCYPGFYMKGFIITCAGLQSSATLSQSHMKHKPLRSQNRGKSELWQSGVWTLRQYSLVFGHLGAVEQALKCCCWYYLMWADSCLFTPGTFHLEPSNSPLAAKCSTMSTG